MNILSFTAAAALCFGIIYSFTNSKELSPKYFKLLCVIGAPAYVVGISTIIGTGNTDSVLILTIIIIAFACYLALSFAFFMRTRNLSSREYTLMVLWGQAAFPVVVLATPEVLRLTGFA